MIYACGGSSRITAIAPTMNSLAIFQFDSIATASYGWFGGSGRILKIVTDSELKPRTIIQYCKLRAMLKMSSKQSTIDCTTEASRSSRQLCSPTSCSAIMRHRFQKLIIWDYITTLSTSQPHITHTFPRQSRLTVYMLQILHHKLNCKCFNCILTFT